MNLADRNFLFRVDASSQIGSGHFHRCLTLARACLSEGARVSFLSRNLPAGYREVLATSQIKLLNLERCADEEVVGDLAHSSWLGLSQNEDAQECLRLIGLNKFDWLVVDHYGLDFRWESAVKESAGRILVIDDLADRRHECDLLLDQNFYIDSQVRYKKILNKGAKTLLGPEYALLRREFSELRSNLKRTMGSVSRILVSFGGVDKGNWTSLVMDALINLGMDEIEVDVVVGLGNGFHKLVREKCIKYGFNYYFQHDAMGDLMVKADLCIGAGGISVWERCCLGLPSIIMPVSVNQIKQVHDAGNSKLLLPFSFAESDTGQLQSYILGVIADFDLRKLISDNCLACVSGNGVDKVVNQMILESIQMRLASIEDAETMFSWRNHPSTRSVSRAQGPIDKTSHVNWLNNALRNENRLILIGELFGEPIGVVRFDIVDKEGEVSIYLNPNKVSNGFGAALLRKAELFLSNWNSNIKNLTAHVIGSNQKSINLFLKGEYELLSSTYQKILKK